MRRSRILGAAVAALLTPIVLFAQVPNEGLANQVVTALRNNEAAMRNYNWNCRSELMQNSKMIDLRIDLVSLGPGDALQHTLLNDQSENLPRGFLRRAIAQGQEQKAEQAVQGLHELVEQYTQPASGKVLAFLVDSSVQPITTPGGPAQLQAVGQDVVKEGDTFTLMINGSTMLPTSAQITTRLHGNDVNISATFYTLPSGLNIVQYATAEIPSQNITVNIHNYDVQRID